MKCKTLAITVLMAILFISTLSVIQAVKAFSDQPIISTGGAFTLYSPLNVTYNSNPITLSVGFESFMDIPYVLSYYIDGKYQGNIPYAVKRTNETHIEYPATGSVDLPPLPKSSHYITIDMNGIRDTTYTATVYFTVESLEKLPSPTISNLSVKPANNTMDSSLQFNSNPVVLYGGGVLYSPVNFTYRTNQLPLNLSFSLSMGFQASLTYDVDGAYKGAIPLTPVATNETHIFHPLTGLVELPQLSEGAHRLTITVVASLNGYFGANPPGAPFKPTGTAGNYEATWVNTVFFTVDTSGNLVESALPAITYQSIENATYNTTQLPLNFNFNENYTLATYSLDGQRSIFLAKNAVLSNLSYGTHTLTLSVTDCFGNIFVSQTSFTVANSAALQTQPQPQKHFQQLLS